MTTPAGAATDCRRNADKCWRRDRGGRGRRGVLAGVCPRALRIDAQLAQQAFNRGSSTTGSGEKRRSRWTPMQTEYRLLVRLTHCGRNAIYCVMRIAERPEGRLLTDTSEPCGHRLSGDEAGFGRSCELGRCITGIRRADTANEIQDRASASSEVLGKCLGTLRAG